jgi:hypothetical protein
MYIMQEVAVEQEILYLVLAVEVAEEEVMEQHHLEVEMVLPEHLIQVVVVEEELVLTLHVMLEVVEVLELLLFAIQSNG